MLVELVHEVRLAEVQVDGALVHRRVRARALDQRRARRRSRRRRPRTRPARPSVGRRARRGSPCRPRRSRAASAAAPGPRRRPRAPRGRGSSASTLVERRLERGRADVPGEDARVRVVEDRGLDAPPEQHVGLAHEVLVERVLARDEHGEAVAAAPGAAPLLAQRRDRAREADRDDRVEQADVDPELERVRRRHAEQLARAEPALDLAPLLRRVAGAVGREPRVVAEPLGREAVDQLGRLAALRERERAQAALDEAPPGASPPPRAASRAGRAPRRGAAGSRARRCARRAAPRRRRSRSPGRRAARRRARRGSRSSPRRAGTAGRRRRSARAAAAAAARSPTCEPKTPR